MKLSFSSLYVDFYNILYIYTHTLVFKRFPQVNEFKNEFKFTGLTSTVSKLSKENEKKRKKRVRKFSEHYEEKSLFQQKDGKSAP